ncbi:MAG: MraY family glycosyltransferase, partial [Planctomycetota bacterium]|nr:MraY family glycosyltransferase [Planctomycetota bacterium]
MIWLILGTIIPSMLICSSAAWLLRRYGPRLGLVDRPGGHKTHAAAVPTAGGLAIWLGVVLPLAVGQIVLWLVGDVPGRGYDVALPAVLPGIVAEHIGGLLQQSGRLWTLLGGGTLLMLLGLVDDRRGLNWKTRIVVQALVALMMVRLGWRLSLFVDMPVLTGTISVLWIVGLVNSFNMLDNMDGLSAGVAAIAAAMLAVVMLTVPAAETSGPQLFVGGFLLVLVGSLLGFLIHNRPPARIFMGDAGSYLVGYFIAMATLSATFAGDNLPRHAILAPLCVLAVPLYDTATVVF